MIGFVGIGLLMLAIALLVIAPLVRRARNAGSAAVSYDTRAVYRERLAELEAERDRGNLSEAGFAEARDDLEREVLEEAERADGKSKAAVSDDGSVRVSAIALLVVVPAVAIAVYATTGRPELLLAQSGDRLTPSAVQRYSQMPPAERIGALETYVDSHPEAPRAWTILAQAYRAQEQYGDAYMAFGRAREVGGDEDAWLVARQAESLLLANGRSFTSGVQRLIDEALDIQPRNSLALMLAGHAAMAEGRNDQAVKHWQLLAETMPEGDQRRGIIERMIARAKGETGGQQAGGTTRTADTGAGGGSGETSSSAGGPSVTARIRLGDNLGTPPSADTPVFLFARRAGSGGGGPPLAVTRTTVGALPAEITLSDNQSMTESLKISQAERVVVTARVALSGGVRAQPGDLEGSSEAVAVEPGASTSIVIDQRIE